MRWTKIDDTTRANHFCLAAEDECYHLREYFSRKSYKGGETNQLIFNLKISPTTAASNSNRGYYKRQAVERCASELRTSISREAAESVTWVPIPPSKSESHPDFDPRIVQVLQRAFVGYNVDVRSLLKQTTSTEADHLAEVRIDEDELFGFLEVDRAQLAIRPLRERIVLFDDVLTTGKHFKCCERRIKEVVPQGYPIIGMFIARAVRPGPLDDFDDLGGL